MTEKSLRIIAVDPQGADALSLLREAAVEARALYPGLFAADAPWPDNLPIPDRGVYLVAYLDELPVACGALRPLDGVIVEVRRMFVTAAARRMGIAQAILRELERRADTLGFTLMRLETGRRQVPAAALYERFGFRRIPAFGEYRDDPVSVCFEKAVQPGKKTGQ
ncbi:MAG: GNAT family N-acetyltransferase [Lysobacterales bacterium]